MILYQLVGCGLLVQWAAALPMNAVTQSSPAVRCQQLSPVPRPKGEAVLVCDVSGIRRDAIKFHWWFDKKPDNIRTPIYTYSDVYDVDEVTSTYRDMVVNETHVISDEHLTSEIKLIINMTNNCVIKFELKTQKHASISEEVNITFEDPQITIELAEISSACAKGPSSTIFLEARCHVDVCFGKPIMSVLCNNIEDADVTVIHEESQLEHQANYFSGSHRIVMLLRNCLQIYCSVTDERGTYQSIRNITHYDNDNLVITAPGTFLLVLWTVLTPCTFVYVGTVFFWYCCYRCNKINTTRYRRDKPGDT